MTPGGMAGAPGSDPLERLVGIPYWSSDSRHVYFARACGQLWRSEISPGTLEMLPFRGDSPAAAQAFAVADPYVTNGLVTRWHVREWTTVVGDGAAVVV